MKLVDANLLLYAVNSAEPMHLQSRKWLERNLSEAEPFAFDWTVLLAFLRISTRAGIFPRPLKVQQAFEMIASWLDQPCAVVISPTDRHAAILRDLILPIGTGGNVTSDAHLAALAMEHGATLFSADTDFSRFPGLSWVNPVGAGSR
jgi:toxin-antitoxin system PIN domain toxin